MAQEPVPVATPGLRVHGHSQKILTLPEELLDLIMSFADHETHLRLRFCCKQFQRLATPGCFCRFRFRLSQLSLDGLIMIANHPILSKCVQELEFNIHQLLWFFDFDHFLHDILLQPNEPWRPPPGLKHLPTQVFTRADLQAVYNHYTSERDTSYDYLSLLLSRETAPDPTNPLYHTYTRIPHALARLTNLRTVTTTFGMRHQQTAPNHHTWRGLVFAAPDPEPPSERDAHKAEHLSILLHILGRTCALLHARGAALPLRTLDVRAIGNGVFGATTLDLLWNADAPAAWQQQQQQQQQQQERDDGDHDERDEGAFYEAQYRTIMLPATHLTKLEVRVDYGAGGVGGTAYFVPQLAAFLKQARALRELGLAVEKNVATGWRTRLAAGADHWRERDILLALAGGWNDAEGEEGAGDGEEEERGVQWPCLRKLSLGVQTTKEGLLLLLKRVAGTLRSLRLCGVRFMPMMGEWEEALQDMREMLELDELELCWLQYGMPFFREGCDEVLVPWMEGRYAADEKAKSQFRRTYRHFETQVVDFVLKKTDIPFVLNQGAFFRVHPEDCAWCEARSSSGVHGSVQQKGLVG